MNNSHKMYTMLELRQIKEDYINNMRVEDIAVKYGRSRCAIEQLVNRVGVKRKPVCKPYEERQYKYQYAIVTADDYELPLTPYVNTLTELSRITGKDISALNRHRYLRKRGINTRLHLRINGELVWCKIIRIDVEGDEE